MASIPPAELQYQLDHSGDNASPQLAAFFILCMVLSAFFVAVRLASRKMMKLGVQADDYTILAGLIIAEGSFIVLLIYALAAGLGKHWITLTPQQKTLFSKLNFAYNILNVSCYPLVKISILLLYRRLFTNRRFHHFVWFGIGFLALLLIATLLVTIFSCTPIRGFWDTTVSARCVNTVTFYWSYTIANIVTDFYLLILPIPVLWSLQISTRQKIGVSLLFMLGCLTCVVSIIRIVYYLRFNPYDPSYSFIGNAYSTPGEVCLAIICACFPTVRPLFRHVVQATHSRLIHSSSSSLSSRDRHRLYAKQDRSSNDQPWLTHEKPYAVDGRGSHDPGRSAMALPASQAVAFSDSKSQPDIECGLASSRINVQKEVVLARD